MKVKTTYISDDFSEHSSVEGCLERDRVHKRISEKWSSFVAGEITLGELFEHAFGACDWRTMDLGPAAGVRKSSWFDLPHWSSDSYYIDAVRGDGHVLLFGESRLGGYSQWVSPVRLSRMQWNTPKEDGK